MLTTPGRDLMLGVYDSKFVGLLSAITNWRTPTATELSYTGYGNRPALPLGAAADLAPAVGRVRRNNGVITFGEKTDVGTVTAIAYGVYTANTGGSLIKIIPMANAAAKKAVGESTSEDIYCPAHGLVADDRVFLLAEPGGVLPAGLSENTRYFVLAAGLGTNSFRVATTSGGAAINITAWGAMLVIKSMDYVVAQFATPSFAIDSIALSI